MAYDIFISYSHKDKPIADAVCASLETAGLRCWIAPRDIAPGADWPTAISNAISECKVMVLIFSAHSNSSKDVGRELILAANNNLVIVPFRLDDIAPEPGKQYYLARTHWLDAMNPPTREQIDKLVGHVRSFLGDLGVTPVPPLGKEPLSSALKRKTGGRLRWVWVALGILLVGAVGVSAALFIPQLAKPVSTVAPSRTAAFTSTLTSTITPTFTGIPTETPTPLPDWVTDFAGPILAYRDTHSHGQNDFTNSTGIAWEYDLSVCKDISSIEFDYTAGIMSVTDCSFSWKTWMTDFVVEARVKIMNPGDSWGIWYRGYLGPGIDYDGNVSLSTVEIFATGPSVQVPAGIWNLGDYNTIMVIVWNTTHAIYVNDTPILVSDLPEGWKNGAGTFHTRGTVVFDWIDQFDLVFKGYTPP